MRQTVGMTRIAVLSLKGGTGKTTVVLGLAGAAAIRGIPALVVDLDPQANASAALGVVDPELTISDALADGRRSIARDAVAAATWKLGPNAAPVRLIASDRSLENRAVTSPGSGARLHRVLDGISTEGELMLIDCPPNLGELTRNALVTADAALIVTDPSYFALTGAAQAIEAVDIVRTTANPRLRLAGIAVNRVRARSVEQTFRLNELRSAHPTLVLEPVLSERVGVPAAQGAGVPIQGWEGSSARAFSNDLNALLATLMSRLQEMDR